MEFIIGVAVGGIVARFAYEWARPAERNPIQVDVETVSEEMIQAFMAQRIIRLRKAAGVPGEGPYHVRMTEQGLLVFDEGGR